MIKFIWFYYSNNFLIIVCFITHILFCWPNILLIIFLVQKHLTQLSRRILWQNFVIPYTRYYILCVWFPHNWFTNIIRYHLLPRQYHELQYQTSASSACSRRRDCQACTRMVVVLKNRTWVENGKILGLLGMIELVWRVYVVIDWEHDHHNRQSVSDYLSRWVSIGTQDPISSTCNPFLVPRSHLEWHSWQTTISAGRTLLR